MIYKRAISLKLYATAKKKRQIRSLIRRYRKAVNFYINSFKIKEGKLDKATLARLQTTQLTQRYKSNALKQALNIWSGYKEDPNKKKNPPKFKGYPILDAKFVEIEQGENTYNLWIHLSTLNKGKRIYLPTKRTKVLDKWEEKGTLIQGCELHEDKIIVWVNIEYNYKQGKILGIDLGMNKLVATSDGEFLGTDFKLILDKIRKTKPRSSARKRALIERDIYIDVILKQIPWDKIGVLCYENLKNMKVGKKGRRKNPGFLKRQQHWTYRQVITRILELCQENRVRPVFVNPKNTSRTCPECGHVAAGNRANEIFCCLTCSYTQDADFVGARNILVRGTNWLRSRESLNKKDCNTC